MPDLRSRGLAWMTSKQKAGAGDSVRIRRGGRTSLPITGVLTIAEYEVIDADSMPTSIKSADWVFKASELVLAGEVIVLRQGDELVCTIDGAEKTFVVMPIANKPAQEAKDGRGTLVTVHSKDLSWPQC
jgi:hypothetical protein